jgi:hypothetical protein
MTGDIQEFINILPNILCDDIANKIKKSEIISIEHTLYTYRELEIPKNSDEWTKIECVLYKNLLVKLKKFNEKFLINQSISLILDSFIIQEYIPSDTNIRIDNFNKRLSRHNFLTFIYFLNDVSNGGIEIITNNGEKHFIEPCKGKLVIFTENIDYIYKYILPDIPFYIITGQIRINHDKLC